MALSSSSMRPASGISYSSSRPMAYAVDYQSRVSSAFEDSLKVNGVDDIQAAAPVQYATATRTTNAIRQLEANRETNSAYNDLAASFNGATTGYDRASHAQNFATIGANIDTFA